MSTLIAGRSTTVLIPVGQALTLAASPGMGNITRLSNPVGGEPYNPVQFTGSAATFGPDTIIRLYRIECNVGTMDYNIAPAAINSGALLAASSSTFLTTASTSALIANLSDPFAGLGAGITSYTTFGTVPGQLSLTGPTITKGAGVAVADTIYSIGVLATSGDGKRKVGETLSFTAQAGVIEQQPGSPTILFGVSSTTVAESVATVTNVLNINRNGVTGDLLVNLTYGGTATRNTDYSSPSSVTVPANDSIISFDTTIINDATVESAETINITAIVAGYITATANKTITISDDDFSGGNGIEPVVLGMNESYSYTAELTRDLGQRGEWRTTAGDYIRWPGSASWLGSSGTGKQSTLTGAGATVKMDYAGRIYSTNGLGLTSYKIQLYNSDGLNRTVQFEPGVQVTATQGITDWVYNSATGIGTGVFTAGLSNCSITILASSIPAGGQRMPTILPTADANPQRTVSDKALASLSAVSKLWRVMTPQGINNDAIIGGSSTVLGVRAPSQRWSGPMGMAPMSRETIVGCTNDVPGMDLWLCVSHIDNAAMWADDAAYYAANLASGRKMRIELSNEVWNGSFNQYSDFRLIGARAGLCPDSVTSDNFKTAAVAETIVDNNVANNSATLLVAVTTNQKIMVAISGVGWMVYRANADLAAGTALPAGGASNANFTLIYNNTQTLKAARAAQSIQSKAMYAAFDAAFVAVGRERPIHVMAIQQGSSSQITALGDWDNTHLVIDEYAGAYYWGGGAGGADLGTYTVAASGWAPAQKDLLYTSGVAAAADAFFAAAPLSIDATVDGAETARNTVATYVAGKSRPAGSIKYVQYEGMNWHVVFTKWPDQAAAFNAGSSYATGAFVLGSDGAVYVAKSAVPAGNAPPNATYWNVKVSSADMANPDKRTATLFNSLYSDQRYGELQSRYFNRFAAKVGGPAVFFCRTSFYPGQSSGIQNWGLLNGENDTGGNNYRLQASLDFINGSFIPAPVFTTAPFINPTGGTTGTTFTATDGIASNTNTTLTRRWLLDGTPIGTGTTVTPNAAGELVLEVKATGAGGTVLATATVTVTAIIAVPTNTVAPAVTGTAQEGQVLTVSNGTWTGSPTSYNYQWQRGGADITGSINNTRTLTSNDVGNAMRCLVTAINAGGSSTPVASNATATVTAASTPVPVNSVLPVISGTPAVGQTLTTTNGTWSNSPTGYAYQWRQNGVDIPDANSSTYVLVAADAATTITCRVTASNAGGTTPAVSNALTVGSVFSTIPFDAPDDTASIAYSYNGSTLVACSGVTTNCSIVNNALRFIGNTRVRWTAVPPAADQIVFFDWKNEGVTGSGSAGGLSIGLRQSSTTSSIVYSISFVGNGTITFFMGSTQLITQTVAWVAPAVGASAQRLYVKVVTLPNGNVVLSCGTATGDTINTEKLSLTILASDTANIITAKNFIAFGGTNTPKSLSIDNVSYGTPA